MQIGAAYYLSSVGWDVWFVVGEFMDCSAAIQCRRVSRFFQRFCEETVTRTLKRGIVTLHVDDRQYGPGQSLPNMLPLVPPPWTLQGLYSRLMTWGTDAQHVYFQYRDKIGSLLFDVLIEEYDQWSEDADALLESQALWEDAQGREELWGSVWDIEEEARRLLPAEYDGELCWLFWQRWNYAKRCWQCGKEDETTTEAGRDLVRWRVWEERMRKDIKMKWVVARRHRGGLSLPPPDNRKRPR